MSEESVHCYNLGCGQKFNPSENNDEACLYHVEAPKFHDAYKHWPCCGKKSTDFTTFLTFPGCTRGRHSDVKKTEIVRLVPQTEIKSEKEEEVIAWNGLNKPDERPSDDREFKSLPKIPMDGLKASIAKYQEESVNKSMDELVIGTMCKNLGCKQVYSGPETNEEECLYHPGDQVFHEGMKYYSCCQIKTSNFDSFLNQVGCRSTKHCWLKEEKNVKVKQDWFARSGYIHVNFYCKNSMPDECEIKTNGSVLCAKISHGFGLKETKISYHLFGLVNPDESKVQISERKVEIVLKQASSTNWPRLHFDTNFIEYGDS